jgi:quercetin dioxygenase-like cupin family protein
MTAQNSDELQWGDGLAALPKGTQAVVLFGNPSQQGPFAVRLRFPADYKVPPHSHPEHEVVTVIEGDFNIGTGGKFDLSNGHALTSGGFMAMPKGAQHYAWSTGGAVIQINTQGPWGITYVDPADDPRQSQ